MKVTPLSDEELFGTGSLGPRERDEEHGGSLRIKPLSDEELFGGPVSAASTEKSRNADDLIADTGRSAAAGVVSGGAALIRGAARMKDEIFGGGVERGNASADALEARAKAIKAGRSERAKQAEADSTPEGNILTGENLSFGKNPSIEGYVHHGLNIMGQLATQLAAAYLTRGRSAAAQIATGTAVGGLTGGGSAAGDAREAIQGMSFEELERESKVFRDLVADGKSPEEARMLTSQEAEKWAFRLTLPVSAGGGAATGAILGKLGGKAIEKAASGTIARTAVGGGLSGLEESIQETGEGVATQKGINVGAGTNRDLGEGSFGNAVLGFVGGAGPGAARGAAIRHAEPAQNQPQGEPTPSQQLAANAMAQVQGDDAVLEQQRDARAVLAQSLAAMDEQERTQAVTHLSRGDEGLAQALWSLPQDQELMKRGEGLMADRTLDFLRTNHAIRAESGLIEPTPAADPTADPAAQPPGDVNAAGFVREPLEQRVAQVDAVKEGRKAAAVFGVDEVEDLDLNGLAQAVVTDPQTGEEAYVVAREPKVLEVAVQRANEVGLKRAMGEVLEYVQPELTSQPQPGTAVVQQVDHNTGHVVKEEVVAPDRAGEVTQLPDTELRMVSPEQALAERINRLRTQQPDNTELANRLRAGQQPEAPPGPLFKRTEKKRKSEAVGKLEAIPSSERADELIDSINASDHLTGEEALKPGTVIEVKPPQKLGRMARAIKQAFGVDVVFVHSPDGLMKLNGKQHLHFHGAAVNGKLFLNVNADTTITEATLNTFGHELTHLLERNFPEVYAKLETVALTRMRIEAAEALHAKLKRALEREGSPQTLARVFRAEVVAEAIGEHAQDPTFWADVFRGITEQSAAQKFYNAVIELLGKMARAFTRGAYIDGVKDMQVVRKAATEAFLDWNRRYEEAARTAKATVDKARAAPPPAAKPATTTETAAPAPAPAPAPAGAKVTKRADLFKALDKLTQQRKALVQAGKPVPAELNGAIELARKQWQVLEVENKARTDKGEDPILLKRKGEKDGDATQGDPKARANPANPDKARDKAGAANKQDVPAKAAKAADPRILEAARKGSIWGWAPVIKDAKKPLRPAQLRRIEENSSGQKLASTPEALDAFWTWFKDSKVVDDKGQPLVVYHGTSKDADFSSFKVGQRGSWFTTDPKAASQYAQDNDSQGFDYEGGKFIPRNTASRVIPAYLSIRNPYKPTTDDERLLREATNYGKAQREVFAKAKAAGHDGIDMGDGVWVALSPSQIKSVNNAGTFSAKSPNVLLKRDEDVPPEPKLADFKNKQDFYEAHADWMGQYGPGMPKPLSAADKAALQAELDEEQGVPADLDDFDPAIYDPVMALYKEMDAEEIKALGQQFKKKPIDRFTKIAPPGTDAFKTWFGKSVVVNDDGSPRVMFHGTSRNITTFRAKQAGAIFVTDFPHFAEEFADMSMQWMMDNWPQVFDKSDHQGLFDRAAERYLAANEKNLASNDGELIGEVLLTAEDIRNGPEVIQLVFGKNRVGWNNPDAEAAFLKSLRFELPSYPNVMPVYVKAEKPFDYEQGDHRDQLLEYWEKVLYTPDSFSKELLDGVERGSWTDIEHSKVQKGIRALGFDSFYMYEDGVKNLAVYSPTQIKSATGNRGTYSNEDPDIRYQRVIDPTPDEVAEVGDVTLELPTDEGTARVTVNAAQALEAIEARLDALEMVRRCLA